jgi:hypothetical protein
MRNSSMSRKNLAIVLALLCAPLVVVAHGLLLDAETDGSRIWGAAYYSSGEIAVNESVALLDLTTTNAAPVNTKTDDSGNFRFDAIRSHQYRVSVYGDEGHTVEIELTAEPKSLPKLIEAEAQAHSSVWPPPAWAVIGGVLLLTLIPALVKRRARAC